MRGGTVVSLAPTGFFYTINSMMTSPSESRGMPRGKGEKQGGTEGGREGRDTGSYA